MVFYYIYRITNIVENKHYYGYRGTKIIPKDDLGKKYFSSSSNKDFIKLQKTNPEQFKYKIIKIFSSKNDAILMEIKLHKKFDVKSHPSFYNIANQLSSGFSCDNKGREGLKGADNKMSKEINIYNSNRVLVYKTYGNFNVLCNKEALPRTMFLTSYYNNGRPIFLRKDKNTWAKKNGYSKYIGWYAKYATEENHTKEEYDMLVEKEINTIHQNSKATIIYNSKREIVYIVNGVFNKFCTDHNLPKSALTVSKMKDGEPIFQTMYGNSRATKKGQKDFIGWYAKTGDNLTEEEYNLKVNEIKAKDLETRENHSKSLSIKKINSKKINIYNASGEIMFETKGNFKEIVECNKLPESLGDSHRRNGKPIFSTKTGKTKAINKGLEKYIGWYAKKV